MAGKRRWLAFATTVHGQVSINANAKNALMNRQASLLRFRRDLHCRENLPSAR